MAEPSWGTTTRRVDNRADLAMLRARDPCGTGACSPDRRLGLRPVVRRGGHELLPTPPRRKDLAAYGQGEHVQRWFIARDAPKRGQPHGFYCLACLEGHGLLE